MKKLLLLTLLICFVNSAYADDTWKLIHSQGSMNFVYIKDWQDQDQYRFAVAELCDFGDICQVLFWKEEALVPKKLPMSEASVKSKIVQWQYNAHTGLRRWLCGSKEVDDLSQCFSSSP